jgi:hypothetical protein
MERSHRITNKAYRKISQNYREVFNLPKNVPYREIRKFFPMDSSFKIDVFVEYLRDKYGKRTQ